MSLFGNKDSEKEVSTGAVFGWLLLGVAIVIALAFGIFVATHKGSDDNAGQSTESVSVTTQVDEETN